MAEWRSPKPQVGGSIPSWPAKTDHNMKNTHQYNEKYNLVSTVSIIMLTACCVFINFYYHFSTPIKASVWIIWFVLSLLLTAVTSYGKLALGFINQSKIELQKVTWPSRQETIQTTTIVMIMVMVTGFVLWAIDSGMLWAIGKLTHLG